MQYNFPRSLIGSPSLLVFLSASKPSHRANTRVIQQLRGTNFTQFWNTTPSSGQKWTFYILFIYLLSCDPLPPPTPFPLFVHVVVEYPFPPTKEQLLLRFLQPNAEMSSKSTFCLPHPLNAQPLTMGLNYFWSWCLSKDLQFNDSQSK